MNRAPGGNGEAARTRALRWGLYGCSALIVAVVALVAVIATLAYLDLGEPESAFPGRLAEAATAAEAGDMVYLLPLAGEAADSLHLFAPGATTAAAIDACLGFAWDKSALIAGHLSDGMPGAFVVLADGAAVDYGWHLVGDTPIRFTEWPCAVTPADDGFVVSIDDRVLLLTPAPDAGD
ncbi:MAG: hypothetical protein ACFCVH_22460 [Alphaproteobacteria bacterium]